MAAKSRVLSEDSGSTLLEIVLATMLLTIAGVALVGGLIASRAVQQKTAAKAAAMSKFAEVVEEVNQQPYANCYGNNSVYPRPKIMGPNDELSVQIWRNGGWVNCYSSSGTDNPVQLIKISMSVNNEIFEEKLVKYP